MDELIGTTLGSYELKAKIGQGGMAPIFKAYQPSLDRFVAIKVLLPSFAAKSPDFVKRFQREAKAIARLHHPNILPVHDFGVDKGYYYIVMRYVEGAQTLTHTIYQRPPIERVFDLVNQVASALAYAHKNGVIHRDVKPSNILLDDGWALLSDFGLAKVTEASTRLTESGRAIGTPAYMSPEQAKGEHIDYRSDIYALGTILYELLTGSIPHDAPTPWGILARRTTQPAPSPRIFNPAISESVAQVVLRSLAINPMHRYEDAIGFATALKIAVADESYREPLVAVDIRRTEDFAIERSPATNPLPKQPNYFAASPSVPLDSQKEKSKERPSYLWRNRLWPVIASISVAVAAVGVWSGSAFGLITPQTRPSETAPSVVAVATSTHTPTLSPASSATPTEKPASPTAMPTNTPLPPTPTQTAVPPTATPANTPTVEIVQPAALPTATPSPTIPTGVITLLKPLSLDEPSYGPTDFEWEWAGDVPPGYGFEVRVWREGEAPAGVHNAVEDNQNGRILRVGENRYRLSVDIKDAAGVKGRSGQYLWTVALVQISPDYADLGQQAEPAPLRFEAGGGGSNGGGSDGGGSGGGGGVS